MAMKIKVPNWLLAIDILTVLLVIDIVFIPSTVVRFILGLPLLLFFPGYALVKAIFVHKKDNLENVGISCVMSVAIVALIAFALNYTSWGVTLEPGLFSVATFTIVISIIAFIRLAHSPPGMKWLFELKLVWPVWRAPAKGLFQFIFLLAAVIITMSALGYSISRLRYEETFSEFYILGLNGKAQDYPVAFTMKNGQVTRVSYSNGNEIAAGWGELAVGIVNQEGTTTTYSIRLNIDNQQVNFFFNNGIANRIDNIELQPGDKWEGEIGFAPQHTGDNQEVSFLLFKNGGTNPDYSLNLWVKATDE